MNRIFPFASTDGSTDPAADPVLDVDRLLRAYETARHRRSRWEAHWRDCYDFAMPQQEGSSARSGPGDPVRERLFDGTAPDAVEQLAASLLSELTPPWSRWFGLAAGRAVPETDRDRIGADLQDIETAVQTHLDRSNFTVEMHQAFLDLVTVGTACLSFEEQRLGEPSAFVFRAVPMMDLVIDDSGRGRIDTIFRRQTVPRGALTHRFGPAIPKVDAGESGEPLQLLEVLTPVDRGYCHAVLNLGVTAAGRRRDGRDPRLLRTAMVESSPFIVFRWMKAAGEVYGRSPVMKALPDIKTANKIIELTLKNASIAVSGIWQADDDGVLNPATISLTPGTIIPKAVGSAGLQPLRPAGQFDISQLMVEDFRARIRHALLADQLGVVAGPRMTATEVIERTAAMARILGATYGRLQSELLTPILDRALAILRRRGAIPDIIADGHLVSLHYRSPLAQAQAHRDLGPLLSWIQLAAQIGPEALALIDLSASLKEAARALGVPPDLLHPPVSASTTPPMS